MTSWPSTSRPPRTATPSSRGSGTSLRLFPFSSILLILVYLWLLVGSVLLCLFCLLCLIIFVLSYLSRIFCLLHSMNFIVILFYPILLYFDILSFISSSKSLFFFFLFIYYLFIIFLFIYSYVYLFMCFNVRSFTHSFMYFLSTRPVAGGYIRVRERLTIMLI